MDICRQHLPEGRSCLIEIIRQCVPMLGIFPLSEIQSPSACQSLKWHRRHIHPHNVPMTVRIAKKIETTLKISLQTTF